MSDLVHADPLPAETQNGQLTAEQRANANEITFALTISQREFGGIRIRGGKDFEDIYLAGDADAVMRDLGTVIQTILSHNHGLTWLIEEASPVTDAETRTWYVCGRCQREFPSPIDMASSVLVR